MDIVLPRIFLYVSQGNHGTIYVLLLNEVYPYLSPTSLDPISSMVIVKDELKRPPEPIAVTILKAKYDQYVGINDPTSDPVDERIMHPNIPNFLP